MAKVLGLGGLFFKSPDPAALRAWYAKWLGVEGDEYGVMFAAAKMPKDGITVWSPFANDTSYFDPSPENYMFNLIVDDLDGALAQVREGGATITRAEGARAAHAAMVARPGELRIRTRPGVPPGCRGDSGSSDRP